MPDFKLTRDFIANPSHDYNLPADTLVQSAKFGRTRVDIWQDPEPSTVFRGNPPRVVGSWPERNWRYVVQGVMSGVAATEAGAKSKGELTAWKNQSNAPTIIDGDRLAFQPGLLRHQIGPAETARDDQMLADQRALILARFPAEGATDPDPQEFNLSPRPPLSATVRDVIIWGGEPVLATMTRSIEDGTTRELIACALPETEGRGWAYVISEPAGSQMDEWKKSSIDLRDLQLDPQTTHYVTRDAAGMCSSGTQVSLLKIKGTMPEAWLPDPGLYASMFDMDNFELGIGGTGRSDELDMTSLSGQPDVAGPVRDTIRDAFRPDPEITLSVYAGERRPDWTTQMSWDGDESVSCGDRFYAAPGWDGFTLIAHAGQEPLGYLSADVSRGRDGLDLHVDMIQVSADHRGARVGSTLTAGLCEIIAREMDAQTSRGAPQEWSVSADTQSVAADLLVRRLEEVLDELAEARFSKSEEGPTP